MEAVGGLVGVVLIVVGVAWVLFREPAEKTLRVGDGFRFGIGLALAGMAIGLVYLLVLFVATVIGLSIAL
ncbi:hypothetical protein [Nocardioides sp.]|uniref:hypothetical protein n=1 Tax=Nocardioides sp. TaxID=35761 RepID=UPI0039E54D7B